MTSASTVIKKKINIAWSAFLIEKQISKGAFTDHVVMNIILIVK